ncbi:hypothetical protein I3842_07G008800 [Carya illinoinensis]|uniref:Enoyl reductase (ER) domain-containing protein n=1 Tax=Carya illinoinensis TaxID=32201 RepID=A0A922EE12_CARIL|nr:hypothetical protein I3842_07G008800 [Carya illinoinensis]
MEVTNRYITIRTHINHGEPNESHFELKTAAFGLSVELGSNDVIVKNLYESIDPYQINRMKSYSPSQKAINFAEGIALGEIDAYGVGRIAASGNPKFEKDDLVAGLITWGEYSMIKDGNMLNKLDPLGFPLTYHVGILGFSGLTAYGGFFEVCKPKKGEKVFVSAASGSVGNLVGQYAKPFGCYVVGCAGSKKKVELLKEQLGFDEAFNYKEEKDLKSTLKRGEMLEVAVSNMNTFGRVAVCGIISEYTDEKRAVPEMLDIVYKRITIRGFLAADYMNTHADFMSTTCDYLRTAKIKALEDITPGVESIPSAFIGLFHGDNVGKKIVKIANE